MSTLFSKSDGIGAAASTLCLVHCLITPVIFIVQTCTATCCSSSGVPDWWIWLDYLFLIISVVAVYFSANNTSKDWMMYALWGSWFALFVVVMNERIELFTLPKYVNYIPALLLVFFHIYNRKYCKCQDDTCCTSND